MPRFLHPDRSGGPGDQLNGTQSGPTKKSLSRLFRKRSTSPSPSPWPSPSAQPPDLPQDETTTDSADTLTKSNKSRDSTAATASVEDSQNIGPYSLKSQQTTVSRTTDNSVNVELSENGHSAPISVAPVHNQPSPGSKSAFPESKEQSSSLDVWKLAYEDFETTEADLFAKFTAIINPSSKDPTVAEKDKSAAEADFHWEKSPADMTIARIEALQAQRATIHTKSAKFRKMFEDTIRLVMSAQGAISAAAASNPYASTAWTAISFVLPLFLVSSDENDAAMEGLNFVAVLMVEYRWKEKCYLSPDSLEDFTEALRNLYKEILLYEASLYVHLNQIAAKRLAQNLLSKGHWNSQLNKLRGLDENCKRITNAIAESRSVEWKMQERKWQQDMLSQPRHQEEKANLQKLYSRYEASKNLSPLHVPGTLEWFLQHPSFLSWRVSQFSSLLWLTHDPDCGKSVLSKYLIDRKAEPIRSASDPTVCYYFFRRDDSEFTSATAAVRSLLHQLFAQRPHLYKYAALDFGEKGDRFLEDFDTLWQIFLASIDDEELEEVICVIDGIDGCDSRLELRKLISGMVDLALTFHADDDRLIKIFVSSRPYMELESEFRALTNAISSTRLQGEKELDRMRSDINLVQESKLQNLVKKRRLPSTVKKTLSEHLSKISNRTYLWLTLTFEFLECQAEIDKKTIPKLLHQIPNTVDDAFTKLLEGVTDPARARRLLQFVLAATNPLSTMEINILMHLDESCTSADELQLWPSYDTESTIRNICGLFANVVDDRVYLIHSTARDYLETTKDTSKMSIELAPSEWRHTFDPVQSAYVLTEACVWFLLLDNFQDERIGINSWRMKNTTGLALFPYAATNWPLHFTQAETKVPEKLAQQISDGLYGSECHVFDLWVEQYQSHCSPKYLPSKATRLMWAAFLGQSAIVENLIHKSPDVDALDSHGRSALFFASYNGSEDTVRLLLDHKASTDIKDVLWQTPLHVSMHRKHSQVSKLLAVTIDEHANADVFGLAPTQYSVETATSIGLRPENLVDSELETGAKGDETAQGVDTATFEQLKGDLREYIAGQNESGKWKSTSDDQLLVDTTAPRSRHSSGLGSGYDALREAISVLKEGEEMFEEGRRLTLSAFDKLDQMAHSESPMLVLYIPRTVAFLWSNQYYGLAEAFTSVLASKIRAIRGVTHSLTKIFMSLHQILCSRSKIIPSLIDGLLTCMIDEWTSLLGSHHYQVVYAWHVYWLVKSWLDGPESASSQVISVSENMDIQPGQNSIQAIQLKMDVAQNQLDCKQYEAAQNTGRDAGARISELPRDQITKDPRMVHLLCEGLRIAGEAATYLQDMERAEAHFREALEMAEQLIGPRHVRTKELRRRLGKWMRTRGRFEEARELETWR